MDNTVIALVSLAALIMLYKTAKHFLGYAKSKTEYRKLRREQEKNHPSNSTHVSIPNP